MNILECHDKDGVRVVCDEDTWNNHIIAEHPEMNGCEAYVKVAIERPYQIYQDSSNVNKRVIYKPFILPEPFHRWYLRVVIEYKKRPLRKMTGYVRTAFSCQNKKRDQILLWEGTL